MTDNQPAGSLPPVEPLPVVPTPAAAQVGAPEAVGTRVDPYGPPAAPYAPAGYLPPAPPPPPGAPAGYYQPNQYGYAYAPVQPPRGLSIASMVLGICGIVLSVIDGFGLFPSIAAIITGHIARKRQPYARGNWIAGLVCGYIGLGISLLWVAFIVVLIVVGISAAGSYSD